MPLYRLEDALKEGDVKALGKLPPPDPAAERRLQALLAQAAQPLPGPAPVGCRIGTLTATPGSMRMQVVQERGSLALPPELFERMWAEISGMPDEELLNGGPCRTPHAWYTADWLPCQLLQCSTNTTRPQHAWAFESGLSAECALTDLVLFNAMPYVPATCSCPWILCRCSGDLLQPGPAPL